MNPVSSLRSVLDRTRAWLSRNTDQVAPLGEDILLARHGDRVVRMTQDRGRGVTVAVLRGGEVDVAPNRLDVVVPAPPAERAAAFVRDYRAGQSGVDRDEVRLLVRMSAIWTAATVAVCSATAWWAVSAVDPEALQAMMMAGGGY